MIKRLFKFASCNNFDKYGLWNFGRWPLLPVRRGKSTGHRNFTAPLDRKSTQNVCNLFTSKVLIQTIKGNTDFFRFKIVGESQIGESLKL